MIGEELVSCKHTCEGIHRDPSLGILPRGLILEFEKREGLGAIIAGLNPGTGKEEENQRYLKNNCTYQTVQDFWHEQIYGIKYYANLRMFASNIHCTGPILWTDIAKCEKASQSDRISFSTHPQTFRLCSSIFLKREIKLCPAGWPIVAVGRDAFTALSFLFPEKQVIGIPHPTGAYAAFYRMFENKVLKDSVKQRLNTFFAHEPTGALWLTDEAKE